MERTLDWRPNWDERSNMFRLSLLDCFAVGSERSSILRRKTVFLDQGYEGACTGFGTAHFLAATPKSVAEMTEAVARELYYEARRQDEWPGEDYEGSSINGVMRAARLQGRIVSWRWCKSTSEVRHALSYHGPLVIGVNWYTGMFEPSDSGILSVGGDIAGGHALLLAGFKKVGDQYWYRLENSWGKGWGDNGGCWISETDLARLLVEDGEFACPKKA